MCLEEGFGDGLKVIRFEFKEEFPRGFMVKPGGKIVASWETGDWTWDNDVKWEIGNEGHKMLKCWFSNESGTGGE